MHKLCVKEQTARCFFAILFDDTTRNALHHLAMKIRDQFPQKDIRWVNHENYHLTLRFMGNIKSTSINNLITHVKDQIQNIKKFNISIHSPELFPSTHHPHVISLNMEPQVSLLQLAEKIEEGVINAGFDREERKFQAHLTLARLKKFNSRLKLGSFSTIINTSVNQVALVQSQLGNSGSIYTTLETIELVE